MANHQLKVIPGGKSYTVKPQVLIKGVNIANNRYVPAVAIITTQSAANVLPFTSKKLLLKVSTIPQRK